MCSRSHGTAVNCTRWVSSCMATQSRKSQGSTPISRSAWTMFGATSSRRGLPVGARSYWPRIFVDINASKAPISAPVTLPPMDVSAAGPALGAPDWIFATTGSNRARIESTLAAAQPARSTTRTGADPGGETIRAVSATGATARRAAVRNASTTSAASSGPTCGPEPASRPSSGDLAKSQSMSHGRMSPRRRRPASRRGRGPVERLESARRSFGIPSWSAAAAGGQRRSEPIKRRARGRCSPRTLVQDGEGQQASVGGDDRAGEAVDTGEGPGLAADHAGPGEAVGLGEAIGRGCR